MCGASEQVSHLVVKLHNLYRCRWVRLTPYACSPEIDGSVLTVVVREFQIADIVFCHFVPGIYHTTTDAVVSGCSSYDTELEALHNMVQQRVVTLLSDNQNIVKQTLLENGITRLAVFFGQQKGEVVWLIFTLKHPLTYT